MDVVIKNNSHTDTLLSDVEIIRGKRCGLMSRSIEPDVFVQLPIVCLFV